MRTPGGEEPSPRRIVAVRVDGGIVFLVVHHVHHVVDQMVALEVGKRF